MPDQICAACNVPRKPIALELLNPNHQIVFYKCDSCDSILRLVERKRLLPRDFGKRHPDGKRRDD
jgi:hypothetical protein